MRVVIQRVSQASVSIDGKVKSSINQGFMILLGVGNNDGPEDIQWLVRKIVALRIFDDADGVMNLSIKDIDGEILVVSQFTLMASCKKGNRPSWLNAAPHSISILQRTVRRTRQACGHGRIWRNDGCQPCQQRSNHHLPRHQKQGIRQRYSNIPT